MAYSKKERKAHKGPRKKRQEDLKITRLDKAKFPKSRTHDQRFEEQGRIHNAEMRAKKIEMERMRTTGKSLKEVRIPKKLRQFFGRSIDS